MRPVNLIPPEERRGSAAPSRTGSLAYIVVAGLGVFFLGVVLLVTTGNKVSERQAEVSKLQQELDTSTQHTQSLQAFASFAAMEQLRHATVTSLANSRFDWERVIRELALILPKNVWLTNVTGTVAPEVVVEKSADIPQRASVAGPALQIVGCGSGQDAVAGFVAALHDIDGVTRVSVVSSTKPETVTAATDGADGASAETDCRTRDFIAGFKIVVAFDAVPEPAAIELPPAAPVAPGQAEAGAVAAADQQVSGATNIVPGG